MNRVWVLGLALSISISCAAQTTNAAEAQEITVRLIDCRSGTPYADKLVTIQFFHRVNTLQPEWKAKTRANGTVEFELPKPPTLFSVFPGTGDDLYPCSDMVFKPTDFDRIISEGVVSRCSKKTQGCRCKFGKALEEIRTRPHELVILTRPITVGEHIRWHIWE